MVASLTNEADTTNVVIEVVGEDTTILITNRIMSKKPYYQKKQNDQQDIQPYSPI